MSQTDGAAIVFENVFLAFDDKVILSDISFSVMPGHMKLVLGASGAGKSTILRLILGLLKPDAGRIFVDGTRVDELTEQELMPVRANLGMVFQESALFDSLTVAENVGYRLYEETDMPAEQVRGRIEEVLGFIGLSDYIDRMPSELSGGQRRRVAIARALVNKPSILLADEPTGALDTATSYEIMNLFEKLHEEGNTIILVTHEHDIAARAHRVLSIRDGLIEKDEQIK